MKAERRHDLKTNELARTLEDVRDFTRDHGNYIVAVLAVIAVIVVALVYRGRAAQQAVADATRRMQALPFATDDEVRESIQKLEQLAADSQDEGFILDTLRRRAGFAMSRAHAADDGTPSLEFLEMARAAHEQILQRYPDRKLDLGTSLTVLATIQEDLFVLDGNLAHKEAARRYLEQIRDNQDLNGTPYQSIALDRLNALDRTFVQVVMVEPPPQPAPQALGPPAPAVGPVASESSDSLEVQAGGTGANAEQISADQVPANIRKAAMERLAARRDAQSLDAQTSEEEQPEPEPESTDNPDEPTPDSSTANPSPDGG